MDKNVLDELNSMSNVLLKSGFFSEDEILEILEDQFIDEEDLDFTRIEINLIDSSNVNFSKLEEAFLELSSKGIVAIHNCGYDIEEGVNDAFELMVHLRNNNFNPNGFCFYTFEDIEESIDENKLRITFGDFENDETKALEIGNMVYDVLKSFDFSIHWNKTVDEQITINPFIWDKKFNPDTEYEMEGAYESFVNRCG